MTNLAAMKKYFEMDGGRKLDIKEVKALSAEEREELGKLCCEALGETHETMIL